MYAHKQLSVVGKKLLTVTQWIFLLWIDIQYAQENVYETNTILDIIAAKIRYFWINNCYAYAQIAFNSRKNS